MTVGIRGNIPTLDQLSREMSFGKDDARWGIPCAALALGPCLARCFALLALGFLHASCFFFFFFLGGGGGGGGVLFEV